MRFSNIERFLRLPKLRPPTRSPSTHIVPGKRALAKQALALTTSLSLALASVPFLPTTASAASHYTFVCYVPVHYNNGTDEKREESLFESGGDYYMRNTFDTVTGSEGKVVSSISGSSVSTTDIYPLVANRDGYVLVSSGSRYSEYYLQFNKDAGLVDTGVTGFYSGRDEHGEYLTHPVIGCKLYSKDTIEYNTSSSSENLSDVKFKGAFSYKDSVSHSTNEAVLYKIDETIENKKIGVTPSSQVDRTGGVCYYDEFFIDKDIRLVNVDVNGRLSISRDAKAELFNVNINGPNLMDFIGPVSFFPGTGFVSSRDVGQGLEFSRGYLRDSFTNSIEFGHLERDSRINATIYSGEYNTGIDSNVLRYMRLGKGASPVTVPATIFNGRPAWDSGPTSIITRIDNIYGSWEDLNPKPQPPAPPADTAPPQITVTRTPSSPDTPASSVTLWIECKDPQGNDIAKPLSIDNGAPVATPFTMRVTENKRISVKATDSYGNFYETIVEVRNIDKSAPVVNSLNPSTTDFTKDNVTITASATDDCKLDSQGYYWSFTPFDPSGNRISETASSSSSFTVTENGTVSLRVKDSMGNMSTAKTFAVRNIDKTPPRITNISVSPDAHANPRDGVLVTVTVEDTPDASGVTSGLNDPPIMWDSTWGKTERVINNNGVVTVRARDKLGNLSEPKTVSIDFIDSSLPYIGSITPDKTGQFVSSPVTYTVEAFNADGTKLTGKAYSWDDGDTWLSNNKKVITENGEYKLTVKSLAGNTATQTVTVSNVDNVKPSVDMRLVKESRTTQGGRPKDVWVLKIEAKDSGSGMDYIETNWDGNKIKDSYFQADVTKPGLYSVMAVDKAGNSTSNEKYITAEMIGSNKEDDKNTDITIDTKPQDGSDLTESGLKSEFADSNNLIYGETGIYNKVTKNFSTYADANYPGAGIAVAARVEPMENSYVSGTMSLEGVNYPMKFNKWNSDVKTKLEGDFLYGFIPYNALKSDIKNQRLKIQVFEHEDEKGKTLVRDGSAVVYVSAQISDPVIRYSYNKADQLLTIVPTSTVAGVKSTKYSYDGGSPQEYTAPFVCEKNNKINITVTDNVQNTQTLALTGSDLGLEGGTGSLPTEGLNPNSNVKSYRSSSRTSDSYLINGNQSNTDVIPSKEVFELFE